MTSVDLMTERYGAPSPWRRRGLLLVSVAVAAVFGGWLLWTMLGHAQPAVDSEMEGWTVLDDHAVEVTMVITLRDDAEDPECLIRAFAADHTTVGELSFVPDPADGQRQTHVVRTERRASSVEPVGCTAKGQPRPR